MTTLSDGTLTVPSNPANPAPTEPAHDNVSTPVDTNYQLQPGESPEQYTARVASYNASKGDQGFDLNGAFTRSDTNTPLDVNALTKSIMDAYGLNSTDNSPSGVSDLYGQISDKLGIGTIKQHFDDVLKEQDDLKNELNGKITDLNNNPWISAGTRAQRINDLKKEYSPQLTELTHRQTLYDSLYKEGVSQARYLTGQAHTEQHQNSALEKSAIDKALQIAEQRYNSANKSNSGITTVGGHRVIYDRSSGKITHDLGPTGASKKTPTSNNRETVVEKAFRNDADAQAAIARGANPDKVYQRWLSNYKPQAASTGLPAGVGGVSTPSNNSAVSGAASWLWQHLVGI